MSIFLVKIEIRSKGQFSIQKMPKTYNFQFYGILLNIKLNMFFSN